MIFKCIFKLCECNDMWINFIKCFYLQFTNIFFSCHWHKETLVNHSVVIYYISIIKYRIYLHLYKTLLQHIKGTNQFILWISWLLPYNFLIKKSLNDQANCPGMQWTLIVVLKSKLRVGIWSFLFAKCWDNIDKAPIVLNSSLCPAGLFLFLFLLVHLKRSISVPKVNKQVNATN